MAARGAPVKAAGRAAARRETLVRAAHAARSGSNFISRTTSQVCTL
jgi:hypothetical protein